MNTRCTVVFPKISLMKYLLLLLLSLTFATAADPLALKIKTDNPGSSAANQFTLPLNPGYVYNFTVAWGDGTSQVVTTNASPTHTYASVGTYIIQISQNVVGGFPAIYFNSNGDCPKLLEIAHWGDVTWTTMSHAFQGCWNLTITATDAATAQTGSVSDFSYAWRGCGGLTSFPLINTGAGTNFSWAWGECFRLTSFPLINTAAGTNFSFAWNNCHGLTSFPLINTAAGTDFSGAWSNCLGLTSFPLINTAAGTNFSWAWEFCIGLTSFPLINTAAGTNFGGAWAYCYNLTSFPLINTAVGTNFGTTWAYCSGLTSFPTLNLGNMLDGTSCFNEYSTLPTSSYSNLLIALADQNTNTGVTFGGGANMYDESAVSSRGTLTGTRGWTITDGGQFFVPIVTMVDPVTGPIAGGNTVTIIGTNLMGTSSVTFGGTAATSVTVVNDTTVTCTAPDHAAGLVDVILTMPGGTATKTNAYTYVVPPTITSLSPASGTTAGGATVTISGANLTGTTAVTFGGTVGTTVTVMNSTTVTCTTSTQAAGIVDVILTTPGGTVTKSNAYTYVAPPTITSLSPASGTTAGGTTVTISGANLTGTTAVTFGGAVATAVTVVNSTTVTCATSAHAAGTVDVILTTPGGSVTKSGIFTYTAPPVITQQPANLVVVVGSTATFTVVATGTPAPTYQWSRSNDSGTTWSPISGATTATYTTPVTVIGDNGAQFRVAVTNSAGLATSNTAILTVSADTVAPTVATAAQATVTGQTVALSVLGADNSGEAGLTYTWSASGVNATGVTFSANGTNAAKASTATVTLSGQLFLTCTIKDATNNSVSSTVLATISGLGRITRDLWTGVTGTALTSIPLETTPTSRSELTSFETPTNSGDNYAQRVCGWLRPTATGTWTFWIASDDNGELWLSTDENPLNRQLIASVAGNTTARQWTKYPSQQSVGITLTVGKAYYIEARHKEGGGGDNLAVAWQGPGVTQQAIPGSVLEALGTGAVRELWSGVTGGAITNIPTQRVPTSSSRLALAQGPTNAADNYASRIRTWFVPPTSGAWTFWIASDDAGELWLGTGASETSKTRIAYTTAWTNPLQWNKYATQQSVVKTLTAGTRYYLEALQKEAAGGDNLAIACAGPGVAQQVIPGAFLVPFTPTNVAPMVSAIAAASPSSTMVGAGTALTVLGVDDRGASLLTYTWYAVAMPAGGSVSFSVNGTNAAKNTTATFAQAGTYTLRATIADQSAQTATSDVTVTVAAIIPTVTTSAISGITSSGATSGGNVAASGGSPVTARGACWSTTANPTIANSKTSDGAGAGAFTSAITGLSANTTYHVRTYATNAVGTAYGADVAFTAISVPTITLLSPASGSITGGTTVTITGTNLTGTSSVTFGGTPATLGTITATSVTCVTPANDAGAVDVVLTTPGGSVTKIDGFTYVPIPTITTVTPAIGTDAGGTTVTIIGTNLTGTSAVTFGGTAATSVTVESDTSVTCVTPAKAVGAVTVALTTPGGVATMLNGFTYLTIPTITSLSPTTGVAGTLVTITGKNLTGTTGVTFGGIAATSVTVVNATSITCIAPTHVPGPVDVVLTMGIGSVTKTNGFTYSGIVPPTITVLSPNSGSFAGATTVTITGTNLTGTTAVTFGGTAATSVTVVSATSVTCVTPAKAAGAVDVVLTTPGGSVTKTNGFTYMGPTITALSPSAGPLAGATTVTITGTNLTGTTAVTFGGTAATSVTVVSATSVTCVTPAKAAAGAVDVVLTTPGGSATKTSGFTYNAIPTISQITPAVGSDAGGTLVTITGTNLTGTSSILFGGTAATSINVTSATSVTCITPAKAVGVVDVALTTPGGLVTKAGSFTYKLFPTITTISPESGSDSKGTSVTITGTNLTGTTSVTFGGTAANSVTVVSDTSVTCFVIPHPAGRVDVVLTTSNGQVTKVGGYTYLAAPRISSFSPTAGPLAGGTTVTITGQYLTGTTSVQFGFGGPLATGVTVLSDTMVSCVAPPYVAGAFALTLTTPNGSVYTRIPDELDPIRGFFFYQNAPVISTVAQTEGPLVGGTYVEITGANLAGTTNVTFDGIAATSVTVVDSTLVGCVAPAHAPGMVPIVLATPSGTTSKANAFTYVNKEYVIPQLITVRPGQPVTYQVLGTERLGYTLNVNTFYIPMPDGTNRSFGGLRGPAVLVPTLADSNSSIRCHLYYLSNVYPPQEIDGGEAIPGKLFVKRILPTITSVSPAYASSSSPKTRVIITGNELLNMDGLYNQYVYFGGVPVLISTSSTNTQLIVDVPPQAPGVVDISVVTTDGSASLRGAFTFVASPTISSIVPTSGSVAGGTSVTISGTNLGDLNGTVTFAGVAATVTSRSSSQLVVKTPAHAVGPVALAVTTNGGTAPLSNGYTYVAPSITSVSPTSGSTVGGDLVTITGSNLLNPNYTYNFGTASASIVSASDTRVVVKSPMHVAGTVDVSVGTAIGFYKLAGAFTYDLRPMILSVTPGNGPTTGGTSVTIRGGNLLSTTGVMIGGIAATIVPPISDNQVVVTTPVHVAGNCDLTVTTANGNVTWSRPFVYAIPAPQITDVSPSSGTQAGGTMVTITGENLTGTSSVTFDGVPATSFFTGGNGTQIIATTPAHAAGGVALVVTTPGGGAQDAFTYSPAANIPPTIITQPANVTVAVGTTAQFTVTVAGTAPLTYQWYRSNDGGVKWSEIVSATNSSYTTPATVAGDDNAKFRVTVANVVGVIVSSAATLTVPHVMTAPTVTTSAVSTITSGSALSGGNVTSDGGASVSARGVCWSTSVNPTIQAINFTVNGSGTGTFTSSVTGLTANTTYHVRAYATNSVGTSYGNDLTFITAPPAVITDVMAWGDDSWTQIDVPATLVQVQAIAAGGMQTMALKQDGKVVVWGDASVTTLPPAVSAGTATAVAAGFGHCLALMNDGSVKAWGDNSTLQCAVPGTLTGVKSIAAGQGHSVALKTDGTVVSWGDNTYGQVSLQPAGLTGITAIAAGDYFTVALKSNGTVVAWGDNYAGQCTIPALPAGKTIIKIAAGGGHVVVLYSDQTVGAWGANDNGQATVPPTLGVVTAIAAGQYHSLAVKVDGTVGLWGNDDFGQCSQMPIGLDHVTAVSGGGTHTVVLTTVPNGVAWTPDASHLVAWVMVPR